MSDKILCTIRNKALLRQTEKRILGRVLGRKNDGSCEVKSGHVCDKKDSVKNGSFVKNERLPGLQSLDYLSPPTAYKSFMKTQAPAPEAGDVARFTTV